MPGSSLLTLIDDIAAVLDDVAILTKVAAKKTAGVLGDDLALNAEQVSGVRADRELPVVWAVAKGSALNKVILVPVALAISALAPWAVIPLLMAGGAFLCFEGFEKVAHKLLHSRAEDAAEHNALLSAVADPAVDLVTFERAKIKAAVRTDFILSAEIIVISLGTVAAESFGIRVAVLCGIAVVMTVGVYGLVIAIVKLDDLGLYLNERGGALRGVGRGILVFAPYLMKGLSIAGTAAMFIVGGGIVAHGIAPLQAVIDSATASLAAIASVGAVFAALAPSVLNAVVGIVVGAVLVAAYTLVGRVRNRRTTR
jgi:uncharacterized protein